MRRTVGEPGMPLHGKWLGPGALGRSASIRAGIVWASFGASFKDCMLSAFPSTSKNLTGQEFHGTAYHDPEDKTRRYNKQSYGRCQAWGHDFLGHRFGWGPHRFACLSHPCRVSGPFLINLIVLNSDGGSHDCIYLTNLQGEYTPQLAIVCLPSSEHDDQIPTKKLVPYRDLGFETTSYCNT